MAGARGNDWASLLQPNEVERRRLQVIGELADAETFRHLTDLDIREGWRCLEAGAGEGSVARWLSEHVGSSGRVVATDVDTQFLDSRDAANVIVVKHDLRTDPCPGEPFDLIHARAVLMHLPERDRVIERMATWLKPGGWLVLEDVFMAASMFSPDLLSRFWSGVASVTATRVGSDCAWALTQPGPLRSSGLADTGASVRIPSTFPPAGTQGAPAPILELTLLTLEQLAPVMAALDLFSEQDADTLAGLINSGDPSLLSHGFGIMSAWGRRPEER